LTTWANTETGELREGDCPECADTKEWAEEQVRALELERRKDRAKITRLERAAERDQVARRDGATWQRIRDHWLAAFPELKPTSLGIKSARATQVFLRLEAGATEADIMAAIDAAREWRWIVYGKRTKSGSKHDLAIDLEQIVSTKHDHLFDLLVTEGYALKQ
jgi:hypothetical protein